MSNTKSYWVITWKMPSRVQFNSKLPLDKDRIVVFIDTLHSMSINGVAGFDTYRIGGYIVITIVRKDVVIYVRMKVWFRQESDKKAQDILISYIFGEENAQAKQVINDVDALEIAEAVITTVIDAGEGMDEDEYERVYKLINLLGLSPVSMEYKTPCS